MKKSFIQNIIQVSTLLLLFVFISGTTIVYAQNSVGGGVNPGGSSVGGGVAGPKPVTKLQNPLKISSIGGLVQSFVEIFSYAVILLAVLALIWVGFQFILARGNSDRLNELKKWLTRIIVGVAIVISARLLISVIINTLNATGAIDPRIIQSTDNAIQGK